MKSRRKPGQQSFAFSDDRVTIVPYTPEPVAVVEPTASARVDVIDEWYYGMTLMINGKRNDTIVEGAVRAMPDGKYSVIVNGKVTLIEAESERAAFVAVAGA